MPTPQELIKKVQEKVLHFEASKLSLSETETRTALINPIFAAIGWDMGNPSVVRMEWRKNPNDKPVDYAFMINDVPKLLVEAERLRGNISDKKWEDQDYRSRHRDHVLDGVEKWARTHTVNELVEIGQLMRFPWAPVNSPRDILNCPQLESRGFFVDMEHPPVSTTLKHAGLPFILSDCTAGVRRSAPSPGEDNSHIYIEELGLSKKELQDLYSSNTI